MTETELVEEAGYIFGNVDVSSDVDKAGLLREVFPPAYLKTQTEGVIGSVVSYMDRETDELEVYVDFGRRWKTSGQRFTPTLTAVSTV